MHTTLSEAARRCREDPFKGEIVLVIEGAPAPEILPFTLEEAVALAKEKLAEGVSPSEASKQAAQESGLARREIYRAIVHEEEPSA